MAHIDLDAPIYVAGHRGMVGSALVRELQQRGHTNLILRTSAELDLREQAAVFAFLEETRPVHVYLAAAKVGGIHANNAYKADFLFDNLQMQANVIEGSRRAGVEKLLFLGSSCIYPKHAPQPMGEDVLLTGALEPTNEPYAIAKIAGLKMCDAYRDQHGCNFISAMPTNLYGPGDNYHPKNSHVLPAMIRRFHEARESGTQEVVCWGTGSPMREFLHVGDLAHACLHLMDVHNEAGWVNVGTGQDVTIGAVKQWQMVGYRGAIRWDAEPDAPPAPRRGQNERPRLEGQDAKRQGIEEVYADFQSAWEQDALRS